MQTFIRKLVIPLVLIGAVAGCKADASTPYEAFLDCNEAMRTASTESAALACYTDELKQEIIDDRFGDLEPWLRRRAAERPEEPRLFRAVVLEDGMAQDREVSLEDGEIVQLLMFEPRGSGFRRYAIQMMRVSGSWKISRDKDTGVGGFQDDGPSPSAELQFTGAAEWKSDGDIYVSSVTASRCRQLMINHVFETYARIVIPGDCTTLTTPGKYRVADLERVAETPVRVTAPELGGLDEAQEGTLEITSFTDNRISGIFRFQASHRDIMTDEIKAYEVSGSFENLPFKPGGE